MAAKPPLRFRTPRLRQLQLPRAECRTSHQQHRLASLPLHRLASLPLHRLASLPLHRLASLPLRLLPPRLLSLRLRQQLRRWAARLCQAPLSLS